VPSDCVTELYWTGHLSCITIYVATFLNFDMYDEAFCSLRQRLIIIFFCSQMCAGDGLPNHICEVCASKVNSFYKFKLMVEVADCSLRDLIRRQQENQDDQV
jgi:hypothetical protein